MLAGNKKEDSDKVNAYLKISARYNEKVIPGSDSDATSANQWGGVTMSFFTTSDCNTNNLNNHSIVSVFQYADSKIIIRGDNEPDSWKKLIGWKQFVDAAKNPDVLLASHHGRQSGYCPELFEAIGKPHITVISDGPYCETSATATYGAQTKSWRVYYPDGTFEDRYCVTTRQDGVIRVKAYYHEGKPRLNVHVQKGTAKK